MSEPRRLRPAFEHLIRVRCVEKVQRYGQPVNRITAVDISYDSLVRAGWDGHTMPDGSDYPVKLWSLFKALVVCRNGKPIRERNPDMDAALDNIIALAQTIGLRQTGWCEGAVQISQLKEWYHTNL